MGFFFRRHTVVFPPKVLDEPFKKLLQCDSRLFNLSQQPFPTHNSPLFQNQFLDFTCNKSVHGCSSSPVVNNDHQGAMVPYVSNLVQRDASFVGLSSYSNLHTQGRIIFLTYLFNFCVFNYGVFDSFHLLLLLQF